ncbi:toll/interleukin-1 receptor domain-containing protein [Anaeromyxobacter diazotrophicus]|uniref:TIR domain-containing protein n=1 Tax=Anaeromyxobacter diazotrophicus TaxID=2590199 RepID=A0A7I9VHZ2_9BACT|nr:toll/interleukin-1 receptor domain-containing protein [Anaeromyxobacter diazotrophicus]GEJ55965.1 hypothetical protein AMYX_07060 [Anaeromyxobacter diazotrophicus]
MDENESGRTSEGEAAERHDVAAGQHDQRGGEPAEEAPRDPREEPLPMAATESATVFISYRAGVDYAIAAAVKRLVEASLEPAPEVFISGESLRPSAIGYKPQIQRAVQRAKAFVGLITPASKAREWIFFEAGAAWGRNQLYAPLLVEAGTEDLSSTIADYQATNASDKPAVERLLKSVAEATGGILKPWFAQRYAAFERALAAAKQTAEQDPDAGGDDVDSHAAALRKIVSDLSAGDKDSADKRLSSFESSDAPPSLKQEARVAKIVIGTKRTTADSLQALEHLDPETRGSAVCQYFMGLCERIPTHAIRHYRTCIAAGDSRWSRASYEALASALYRVGDVAAALTVIHEGLCASSRELRSNCALLYARTTTTVDPIVTMLFFAYAEGMNGSSAALERAVNLAIEREWLAVAVHYAREHANTKDGSTLQLGRALHVNNLRSQAYLAYKRAADAGINVAKVNLALLLTQGPNHAGALEILETHAGRFNVAHPDLPYKVRADCEQALNRETQESDRLAETGGEVAGMLASTAADGLSSLRRPRPLDAFFMDGRRKIAVTATGPHEYSCTTNGFSAVARCPEPEFPFWILEETPAAAPGSPPATLLGGAAAIAEKPYVRTVLAQDDSGALRGFRYDFSTAGARPTVVAWQPCARPEVA